MNHPQEYRDQEVVVIGLAKSGAAAAKLFHRFGARVVANDIKERQMCPEADELEVLGIFVICGGHPESLIHPDVSLVVKNPGIPYTAPPIQKAQALGIEIVTEVEIAASVCRLPIIGITGSNGKTTTTTWVGKMFEDAGLKPIVAGNIGTPLCDAVMGNGEGEVVIAELSSFQLKGTSRFRPRIACLLNIYETHLDYHGMMEDYIASKAKLFQNQTDKDTAVINWDDPLCRELVPQIRARLLPFSAREELSGPGVFVSSSGQFASQGPHIVYRDGDGNLAPIIAVKDLGLPGKHNVENALAATAVAMAANLDIPSVSQSLRRFRGVEHRLERVGVFREAEYYNDSKATNPSATIRALDSFEQKVILIAGGLDRGSDFAELLPWFREKVKAVVTLGQTREKICEIARKAGISAVQTVEHENAQETLRMAVQRAAELAEPGDIVLFSPACASWDMFPSYEVRGRIFKESVHNL